MLLTAKQRTFDKQLAEEETRLQAIEAEKEAAKSSNLELETSLLKLKNDLEELSTKYSAAEKKKKRLQEELDEVMEVSTGHDELLLIIYVRTNKTRALLRRKPRSDS